MKGKDFLESKWCKKAASPEVQNKLKDDYYKWISRVNNCGILGRAKQLFEFFISNKISGTQKILVAGALLYIISPIDIIPDFIPVVGWLDDLGIASFALSYIFSQMDKLELAKLNEKCDISTEKLLDSDIAGTENKNFDLSDISDQEFCIDIEKNTQDLQKRLNDLSEIAAALNIEGADKVINKIEERIASNKIQKIAIVGRYSTGKSTLINALLGQDLLPTSPIPTTKAITYIMKGEPSSLYSETEDGEIVVHESVNELRNIYDHDIKKAHKITVTIPDFPFDGLTVADTPGIEDPDQDISQRTFDIIPDMDAVIVVFDSNYIDSAPEYEFISHLLKNDKDRKLFIVINKIDTIDENEVRRKMQLCNSHLIAHDIQNTRIFAVSAKKAATDDRFVQFKQELFNFLTNDIKQESFRHSKCEIDAYSQTLLEACDNAVKVAGENKDHQKEIMKAASENIEHISAEYDNQKKNISRKFQKYRADFFLEFAGFIDRLKGATEKQILNSKLSELRNNDNISCQIKQKIVEFIDESFNEIDQNLKKDLAESQNKIKQFLSTLKMPLDITVTDFSNYSSFVVPGIVIVTFLTCGFFTAIGTLIFAMIGRKFFEEALDKLLSAISVNIVRKQLADEVGNQIDKVKERLDSKLNETFNEMEEELLKSFEAAQQNATVPLRLVTSSSMDEITKISECRKKLLEINAYKN